ncbi:hypothetical protein KDRO_A04370 [Kluyveromyces lactis]|nr:hypothetical protein KDRO_A04370 [Kluyveromyces lactis]
MKFSTVAATALAASSSALAAQTVITATNDGVVYTKTIELADTDATLAEGEYLTSIVVTRGDTVYTKVLTASSAVAETTTTAAETTAAAAAEDDASTTEYETVTLTLSKNGHWFTKTVTQPVGYVWTGEATTYTGVAPWATSSAAAEEETSTTEYETVTLTLSKNGHWFTKTVTQPVGYVWTGEATTYTGVAPWASSSAAAEEGTSTTADAAEDPSSTTEYETKTLTLSKNGHWFTKTVTQPVGYVWTGEATTYTGVAPWASSSAADDEITSSGFNNSTDVTETVTDKSSTTATITSCEDDICHKTTQEEASSTVITTVIEGVTVVTTVPCTTTSSTKAPVNPTTEVSTTEVPTTEAPGKTSSGIVTVSSSSAETAQPSVTVSTYTGAAALASVGTGLFAAAVGAMLL